MNTWRWEIENYLSLRCDLDQRSCEKNKESCFTDVTVAVHVLPCWIFERGGKWSCGRRNQAVHRTKKWSKKGAGINRNGSSDPNEQASRRETEHEPFPRTRGALEGHFMRQYWRPKMGTTVLNISRGWTWRLVTGLHIARRQWSIRMYYDAENERIQLRLPSEWTEVHGWYVCTLKIDVWVSSCEM
jgi:hypothetical protein